MAMARGHLSLGRLSPWHSNSNNQTHQIPHNKTLLSLACLASRPRSNSLQAQVAPDGQRTYPADEPPTSGPSPSSKPPEDIPTREPEPEVAPTQSMKEPFGKSPLLFLYYYQLFLTPPLTISSSSRYSTIRNIHRQYARPNPPAPSVSL
ncbi:hypothetical protein O181_061027 [Austropuccinia psidii MF-1]|uniref:Uncharacterized protein n=1 Tax=Austropuccinia psidii MF-1 TaxID=1389203 RepID=A0A9Q3EPN3_9BASI|nr:hypothetical protein [Austropuccinia psidii MF-1]